MPANRFDAMPKRKSKKVTRRSFLRSAAVASGALAFPMIVPSRLFGAEAPSNRVRVGQIGCGRIATVHDLPGVVKSKLADVVAVCDLDSKRAKKGRSTVRKLYYWNRLHAPDVTVYTDYQELLARPDIDAVVISLPDHWHAQMALAATLAGKDIYLQKP